MHLMYYLGEDNKRVYTLKVCVLHCQRFVHCAGLLTVVMNTLQ